MYICSCGMVICSHIANVDCSSYVHIWLLICCRVHVHGYSYVHINGRSYDHIAVDHMCKDQSIICAKNGLYYHTTVHGALYFRGC